MTFDEKESVAKTSVKPGSEFESSITSAKSSNDSDESQKEVTSKPPHERIIRLVITFIKNFFYQLLFLTFIAT